MTFRTEIEKISVTIRVSDGTLGKVLSSATASKKKLFGTVAARGILAAFCIFFWVRTGESIVMTAVLGSLFGMFCLSPLRFLGNKIEFCEHGIRHNGKEYPLPQQLDTTWTTRSGFSIFWTPVALDLGSRNRLDITYLENTKKAFLVAYDPNTIL